MHSDLFLSLDPTIAADGEQVDAGDAVRLVAGRAVDPLRELARRAAAGDRAATRAVLEGVSPAVLAGIRRILGHEHAAVEDVLQESLVAFVTALSRFRGESSLSTYAASIGVRTALSLRRQQGERKRWDAEHRLEERALPPVSAPPDEDVQRERRRELLRALLAELPAVQAETFALRVVMQYSLEEVAEATGAPSNTVRSRLRLAREALRARIDADPKLLGLLGEST